MKADITYIDGPELSEGTRSIICSVEAQILTNNQVIPYYDYKTDVGYQRQPGAVRIKELAKKLYTQDVDLPTLVLVNIRNLEATNHLKNGTFKYNPAIHGRLFLFDGQHRILAMQQAIEIAEANKDSVNLERLRKKLIPTMITFTGDNELLEMKTFYSINKNSKNVPINDAAMILHRAYVGGDAQTIEEIEHDGARWKIEGGKIAKRLNSHCSAWSNRIKAPGQKIPQPNITFAAMTTHLKPFTTSPDLEGKSDTIIADVVCAMWSGLESSYPEMFASETAKNYAIQTSSATEVIHKLWDNIRVKIQNSSLPSKDFTNKDSYAQIMKELITACKGTNGQGDDVSGTDFWRKGKLGVAGTYTSNSAKGTLLAILKGHLSDISV